jgi:ketosteroid isomerase-like protein
LRHVERECRADQRHEDRRGQSGATAEARLYLIYTIRDGKICRYREFYDEGAARAALDA